MNTRILITRAGCVHCRQFLRIVDRINSRLPIEKRIKVYDNRMWEEFGFRQHLITEKLEQDGFDGYPFMYCDGIVVGEGSSEILYSFLNSYFKEDFVIK